MYDFFLQVAREIHFGDQECFFNETFDERTDHMNCSSVGDKKECDEREWCVWDYSGLGYQYQILAGPAFIAVFSVFGVVISILSDRLKKISRVVLLAVGSVFRVCLSVFTNIQIKVRQPSVEDVY